MTWKQLNARKFHLLKAGVKTSKSAWRENKSSPDQAGELEVQVVRQGSEEEGQVNLKDGQIESKAKTEWRMNEFVLYRFKYWKTNDLDELQVRKWTVNPQVKGISWLSMIWNDSRNLDYTTTGR